MNSAADIIAREIRQHGAISFARFMECALYCPVCGYYEQEADKLGRRGDYFTSVSVGSLFGDLLAFQFAKWLSECGAWNAERESGQPQIVEAGAHDGTLARDILTWLREHRPGLFAHLEYRILEPSARRQEWQSRTLVEFGDKVRWISGPFPRQVPCVEGVIFSNELLDALPLHRLGWDAQSKAWFEWGVALQGDRFAWARIPGPLRDSRITPCVPAALLAVLPHGFTTEVCPAATEWWRAAASVLQCGKLLTLDYGLVADEFVAPHRHEGTLRAYRRHQVSGDLLANPGEQDLTAHVNFTVLQAAGEAAGLATESFATQSQFLVRIAEQTWRDKSGFGEWNAERLRQFKMLTHPEHLGRSFHVLIQARAE